MTDNLFSRFGLIMLIGMVAKNGILIGVREPAQVEGRKCFDAAYGRRPCVSARSS